MGALIPTLWLFKNLTEINCSGTTPSWSTRLNGSGFVMNGLDIPVFSGQKNRQLSAEPTLKKEAYLIPDDETSELINSSVKQPPRPESILSIGNGVVLSGKIVEADRVIIHGSVDAEINARSVDVAAEGSLTGTTTTADLSISGTFRGNAQVTEKLTIEKGGSLEGDVSYGELSVECGGLLFGNVSRSEDARAKKSLPRTQKMSTNVKNGT